MNRHLLLLFCFFSICPSTFGQNTILWKIKSPKIDSVSYLLGTYHQMGNSFVDSIPEIKKTLYSCDAAVFESLGTGKELRKLLNSRKENFDYEDALRKRDIKYLNTISSDWGVPVSKLTPPELITKLQQVYLETQCGTIKPNDKWTHFDSYLIHLSKEKNIELIALENDSLQTKYINESSKSGVDWRDARKPVKKILRNIKKGKKRKKHCQAAWDYMKLKFDYQFNEKCGENIMLKQRNQKWLKKIVPLIQKRKMFIAVGLLHLYGDCGLIEQLRNNGYSVEPVKIKAP